jgi:tetratricopeptide (TPR) repeat protein
LGFLIHKGKIKMNRKTQIVLMLTPVVTLLVGMATTKIAFAQTAAGAKKPKQVLSQIMPLPAATLKRDEQQRLLHLAAQAPLQARQWMVAQKKLEAAIAIDPDRALPHLYHDLARCLEGQGRLNEALVAMRKVFFGSWQGMESNPEPLVHYAQLAEALGKNQEAQQAYLQAVTAGSARNGDFANGAPNNPTRIQIKALAHVAAGQESHRLSDDKAAESSFRKALALDPKCGLAHLNLAMTLPKNEEALAHFNQAAKLGSLSVRQFSKLKAEDIAIQIRQKAK